MSSSSSTSVFSRRQLVGGTALLVLVLSLTCCNAEVLHRIGHAWAFVTDFVFSRHSLKYTGEKRGLQVIGAGFGRTGTKSIEAALHDLGHRIYDLRSIMENQHGERWVQCAKDWKQGNPQTCADLVQELEAKGYTATMDYPINVFAPIFAELRPEAKVIYSVRDTEEKWINSWASIVKTLGCFVSRPWKWIIPEFEFVKDTVYELEGFYWREPSFDNGGFKRPLPWFEILVHHPHLDTDEAKQEWIEMQRNYRAKLEKTIPQDRLLVYNVKQGWEPLVPFLGLDESLVHEKFPHINDMRSVRIIRLVMDFIAIGLPVWVFSFLYTIVRVATVLWYTATKTAKKLKTL